jgi:hypothetical protein
MGSTSSKVLSNKSARIVIAHRASVKNTQSEELQSML